MIGFVLLKLPVQSAYLLHVFVSCAFTCITNLGVHAKEVCVGKFVSAMLAGGKR